LMNILKANTFEHPFEKAYNRLKELVPVDSTNVSSISDYLYGFALKSDAAAKDVIGLSNSRSNVAIHYHTSLDTSIFYMGFNLNSNFNNISSDRTLSTTSDIVNKEIAYELGGTRHVQAGTGVMTQVSLNEVLSFINSQENMIVSSSELEFENVNTNTLFPPPVHFNLLHSTNQYRRGTIFFNGENINLIYDDNKEVYSFLFDEEVSNYKGLPRKYFQELYDHNKEVEISKPEDVISEAYLMVQPANNGFSLNRFSINNEDIKLKLYYSLPK